MSLESQIEYRRSLKKFLNHFQKNVIFRLSALGRPKAGLTPDMATGLRPVLKIQKTPFSKKIEMVYAKSALTMLFGMLFLL